jgi:hypothetical protein
MRNGQAQKDRISGRFFRFRPSRLRSFSGASASLFVSHCFQTALTADPAALCSHAAHNDLLHRKAFCFGGFNGGKNNAAGVLDGIKFHISACPLWHDYKRGTK